MFVVNKKMWSFNFGCFLAASFVWLSSFGVNAPVPEILQFHPDFVIDYYPGIITALSAFLLSGLLIVVMAKGFNICTSEHTFWLILPSITFILMAMMTEIALYASLFYAAIPSLLVVSTVAIISRFNKINLSERILKEHSPLS